ncbi:MAG TPA: 50S ribosomal protein L23 [Candidatus Moranbacteria bacterium]|nr:50S ribosomal protein L23 [Candidatus Moranbacteria bacterium]
MTEEKSTKKVTKKTAAKKAEVIVAADNVEIACNVLVAPWITEKTHRDSADNKYTFRITHSANKKEVKKAVEGIYKVKVEKVSIVNLQPKKKAYGRHLSLKPAVRKATVTVKKGDKIEFFKTA